MTQWWATNPRSYFSKFINSLVLRFVRLLPNNMSSLPQFSGLLKTVGRVSLLFSKVRGFSKVEYFSSIGLPNNGGR